MIYFLIFVAFFNITSTQASIKVRESRDDIAQMAKIFLPYRARNPKDKEQFLKVGIGQTQYRNSCLYDFLEVANIYKRFINPFKQNIIARNLDWIKK